MAQIQVIDRQADPTAQIMQKAGEDVTGAIQQEQAMGLTANYYKILKQHANTEQEKAEWDNRLRMIEGMQNIKQTFGDDPQASAIALKDLMGGIHDGDHSQGFTTLGKVGQDVQERLQQLQGGQQDDQSALAKGLQFSPGEAGPLQQSGADVQQKLAQARIAQLTGNIMQNPAAYMQQASGGAPSGGAGATTPAASGSAQPQVQDMATTAPLMDSMGVNAGPVNMQFTNPRAKVIDAMAQTAGGEYARKQFEQAPAKAQLDNYQMLLNKANQEIQQMGGNQDTELGAKISGNIGGALAHLRQGSAIPALEHLKFQMGNMLASSTEHGRPNLTEVNALGKVIPYFDQSQATQRYLTDSLKTAFAMPGKGLGPDGRFDEKDRQQMYNYLTSKTKVVDAGEKFYKSLIARGVSPDEANMRLEKLYQKQGQ